MVRLLPPRRVRFGSMEAIELPAGPDNPVVLCLHGYGADGADLASLGEALRLGGPVRWLFPDAPTTLRLSPFQVGRAWFPIPPERLEAAQRGEPISLAGERPAGLDEAVASVRAAVEQAGLAWSKLLVGGFSQGAMAALELALGSPEPPLGLFLLSGTLVDEASLKARAPARAGLPFFQCHGRQDPLLPFEAAEALHGVLTEAGLEGRFLAFDGGHALPAEAVAPLQAYLSERVREAS